MSPEIREAGCGESGNPDYCANTDSGGRGDDSAPAGVVGGVAGRERLDSAPIVIDLERLARDLGDGRATGSHDHLITATAELERVDLAALLQSPAEGLDHLLGAVADPVLT